MEIFVSGYILTVMVDRYRSFPVNFFCLSGSARLVADQWARATLFLAWVPSSVYLICRVKVMCGSHFLYKLALCVCLLHRLMMSLVMKMKMEKSLDSLLWVCFWFLFIVYWLIVFIYFCMKYYLFVFPISNLSWNRFWVGKFPKEFA